MSSVETSSARKVESSRGLAWWSEAWALFLKNPGLWIVFALIMLVIFIVLSLIPIVGGLAASLFVPVFGGAWLLAVRKAESGARPEVADLFACFQDKEKLTPLLILGAVMLVASLVIGLVVAALGMGAVVGGTGAGLLGSTGGLMAALAGGSAAMLIALVVGAVIAMAMWFAPALVVFRNVPPIEALKASVEASLQNWLAFLVFGVIYLIGASLSTLLFGLGWILLVPLSMLAMYQSYKDVYGD